MKTAKIKLLAQGFLFSTAILTFNSCSVTDEIEEIAETAEETVEEVTTDGLTPLQRIYQCSLDGSGNIQVSPTPVVDGSIRNNHVHVITHGWAPGYRPAVKAYSRMHPGETLLAWQPEAVADGERFFVGSFLPLAESILKADPESAVLVFSWIDISATDTGWDLAGDYHQFCTVEARTPDVGIMLRDAVDAGLASHVHHELHLLGHSFGTKVVSIGGVELKKQNIFDKIHLTLFDSPERVPWGAECGDNQLYKILPEFAPDRRKYFVDNYISYWDECLSNHSEDLNWVVDATIIPYQDSCHSMFHYSECASCSHSAGVNWYTDATNHSGKQSGLWWSPLMGELIPDTISRYQYKPASNQVKIHASNYCQQDVIKTCDVPSVDE